MRFGELTVDEESQLQEARVARRRDLWDLRLAEANAVDAKMSEAANAWASAEFAKRHLVEKFTELRAEHDYLHVLLTAERKLVLGLLWMMEEQRLLLEAKESK